jgi:hypothetical protein
LIKQLVLEGPGRAFILRFDATANGRNARFALKAHYEGNGFRNWNIVDAYSMHESLSYKVEKRGLTFE